MEMAVVLRELLRAVRLEAGTGPAEATVRRAITAVPGRGGESLLAER